MPVHGEDDAAIIHKYVIELDGADGRTGGGVRNEVSDLLRAERVPNVISPDPAIEERAHDDVLGLPRSWNGGVLMDVMGPVPASAMLEHINGGHRQRADADQVAFIAHVNHPHQL